MLSSGRAMIKTEEQFQIPMVVFSSVGLHDLVVIGGVDSTTIDALSAEYVKATIRCRGDNK